MGRELRKVPANWEHPKDDNGKYIPMHNQYFGDRLLKWMEENSQWMDGTHPALIKYPEYKEQFPFYSMYGGNPPDVEQYQTKQYAPEELTHIQLYEDTSEGTPLSPVFPADQLEQLCEYAAEHCTVFGRSKTSKEEWLKMLTTGIVHFQSGNVIFM